MPNLVNDAPVKKNYDFIDHIRCIAMMSIVAEHTLGEMPSHFQIGSLPYWVFILFVQFAKFGTVIFFLLAGFLISEKFTDYTPGEYLKRRLASTFWPWVFWSVVFVVLKIITLHITARIYHDDRFNLHNIVDEIRIVYLYTNYWFIINFMVSITLLLIFKKYLYSPIFGAVLLLFTLFYCVNIHFEWIDPSHTIAILGFIFFLWLGAQLRRYWQQIEVWVQKTSYWWLFLALGISFLLSLQEINMLSIEKSMDPLNTLRISNVFYSLSAFFLMLKIKHFNLLNHLKPRQTTYGIYLIHYIIIIFVMREFVGDLRIDDLHLPTVPFFLFKTVYFVIAYSITVGVVLLINKTPAKKLIGN